MKALKKSLIGLAVSAACIAPAFSATNNIEGVIWDPNSTSLTPPPFNILDFNAASATISQTLNPDGTVTGFGRIDNINGAGQAVFCPGCELTFTFSIGAFASQTNLIGMSGVRTLFNNFTSGSVNLYVDATPNFDINNAATASDTTASDAWLKLVVGPNGFTGQGIFNNTGTTLTTLKGDGDLDVVGGLAAAAFDTNTLDGGGDIKFSNTFTSVGGIAVIDVDFGVNPGIANGFTALVGTTIGTGTFTGDTIAVPEPASLALVGLGLLGLAGARRRKSV